MSAKAKTATREKKAKRVAQFGGSATNTGTTEVQVALITDRINEINGHSVKNKFDFSARRGLLKLVGQRRRLLNYLKQTDAGRYVKLIQSLELRK